MKQGFTLIELLIVVAIIGIIAAIAVPQLVDYIQRARCERTEADARTIATSLGAYYNDFDKYPSTGLANMIACLQAGYLEVVVPTDGWNNPWVYTAIVVGGAPDQNYSLESYAKDGAPGPIATKDQINPNDPSRHAYDVVIYVGKFSSNCK
jgi:type II secretion system protein G